MASLGPSLATLFDLPYLLGPEVVGCCVCLSLTGVVWAQATQYFLRYHGTDRKSYEVVVAVVVVLVTAFAATNAAIIWAIGISQDWQFRVLKVDPLLTVKIWFGIWPNILCQCFFLWRLYILSRAWWYCAPLAVAAIASAFITCIPASLTSAGAHLSNVVGEPQSLPTLRVSDYGAVSFYISFGVDVLLATGLTYAFHTRRSGFSDQTDTLLQRLMRMTLSNCAITALLALAIVLSVRFAPASKTSVVLAFGDVLAPIFALCLLYSLNSRDVLIAGNPSTHGHASGVGADTAGDVVPFIRSQATASKTSMAHRTPIIITRMPMAPDKIDLEADAIEDE